MQRHAKSKWPSFERGARPGKTLHKPLAIRSVSAIGFRNPQTPLKTRGRRVAESRLCNHARWWVRRHHFRSISELVQALQDFRAPYNYSWLIARLGFQSLVQVPQRLALEPDA